MSELKHELERSIIDAAVTLYKLRTKPQRSSDALYAADLALMNLLNQYAIEGYADEV